MLFLLLVIIILIVIRMIAKNIKNLLFRAKSLSFRPSQTFSQLSHTIQPTHEFNLYHREQQFKDISGQKLQNPYEGHFNEEGQKKHSEKFSHIWKKSAQVNEDIKLELSSIGVGSYNGSLNSDDDLMLFNAIIDSVLFGMNVIDTCSNFRGGRSEKCIGYALRHLFEKQKFKRNQLFIGSKAGYVRQQLPTLSQQENNIINSHCVHPLYLEKVLNNSLDLLDIKTLDVFYLNNFAECQLEQLGKDRFQKRLLDSFQFMEKARADKKIQFYGLASWESFRIQPTEKRYLNLEMVTKLAQKVGGRNHGFRFLQVPINIMMPEAFAEKNQAYGSLLETAQVLNINVISCSPILNGSLINVPLPADRLLCRHNGAKHLQFIRSVPSSALVSTLIGQKQNRHVKRNAEVLSVPSLDENQWLEMIMPSEATPVIEDQELDQN